MATQPIGGLIKTIKGKKPKVLLATSRAGLVPYIDISAVEHRTKRQFADPSDARLVPAGTLVMVWDGARSGWVGITPFDGALGSTLVALESPLEKRFLAAFLRAHFEDINSNPRGTGIPHVNPDLLAALEVPLLSQDEQVAIAGLTEAVAEKAASSQSHLETAERSVQRFRRAVLAAATGGRLTAEWRDVHSDAIAPDLLARLTASRRREQGSRYRDPELNPHAVPDDLADSWVLCPLGLLLRGLKYGTSQRCEYANSGTPVLRIPNVSGEAFDTTDLKFAPLDYREIASLALQRGDLLMVRSNGSVELVGKTLAVPESALGMAYAGYLMRLRPDTEAVDSRYLEVVLASPRLRNQIELPARSTSGVHNINSDEVRGLGIPLPPLTEQIEIVRRVEQLMALADSLLRRIDVASVHVGRTSRAALAKALRVQTNDSDGNGLTGPTSTKPGRVSLKTVARPTRTRRAAAGRAS